MYDYEKIVKCAEELGLEQTFTKDMLETILAMETQDDKVLYGLIVLFGDKAFTDEAKEFLSKN